MGSITSFRKVVPSSPSFPNRRAAGAGRGGWRRDMSLHCIARVCVRALQTLGTPRKGAGVGAVSRASLGLVLLRPATHGYSAWTIRVAGTSRQHTVCSGKKSGGHSVLLSARARARVCCVFLAKNGTGMSSSFSGGYRPRLQSELLLLSLLLHCCSPLAACTRVVCVCVCRKSWFQYLAARFSLRKQHAMLGIHV